MQPIVHSIGNEIAVSGSQALEQQGQRTEVHHGIPDRDRLRHGTPGFAGAESDGRDRHNSFHSAGPFTTNHPPSLGGRLGGHAEPPEQRWNHVVRMAFDIDGELQKFLFAQGFPHQGIGTHEAGNDGGGAAAQAAGRRNGEAHPGFKGHRFQSCSFPDPLSRPVHQVFRASPEVAALRSFNNQFKPLATAFDAAHFKAIVQIQSGSKTVEPRSEVGGGCRHIHHYFLTDARLRHPCASS